jgi:hypothetical protein
MSEELRKAELRKAWLDAQVERVSKFLRTYGCHLANHTDITNEIRGMMNNSGGDWPWFEKWATEDSLAWVNDLHTRRLVQAVKSASNQGNATDGF